MDRHRLQTGRPESDSQPLAEDTVDPPSKGRTAEYQVSEDTQASAVADKRVLVVVDTPDPVALADTLR